MKMKMIFKLIFVHLTLNLYGNLILKRMKDLEKIEKKSK